MLAKNPGRCPTEAAGKRIRGVLRNGTPFGFEPVSAAAPAGWQASTTDWRLTGSDFDVVEWEIVG